MDNAGRLKTAFASAFDLEVSEIPDDLEYEGVPEWDSVGHMALIASIEELFRVELDGDDIMEISSLEQAKAVLMKKGVSFS